MLELGDLPALGVSDFLEPDKGPPQTGDFPTDPGPYVAVLIAGFIIGTAGHIFKSKTMVAMGILMIALVTFLIPLYLAITK